MRYVDPNRRWCQAQRLAVSVGSIDDLPEPLCMAPVAWLRRVETISGGVPMYFACFPIDLCERRAGGRNIETRLLIDSNFDDRVSFHD